MKLKGKLKKISNSNFQKYINLDNLNTNFDAVPKVDHSNEKYYQNREFFKQISCNSLNFTCPTGNPLFQRSFTNSKGNSPKTQNNKVSKRKTFLPKKVNVG